MYYDAAQSFRNLCQGIHESIRPYQDFPFLIDINIENCIQEELNTRESAVNGFLKSEAQTTVNSFKEIDAFMYPRTKSDTLAGSSCTRDAYILPRQLIVQEYSCVIQL